MTKILIITGYMFFGIISLIIFHFYNYLGDMKKSKNYIPINKEIFWLPFLFWPIFLLFSIPVVFVIFPADFICKKIYNKFVKVERK